MSLFEVMTEEINLFIGNFAKSRSQNIIERLCDCFIEVQNEFSIEYDYVKPSEYFPKVYYFIIKECKDTLVFKNIFLHNFKYRDTLNCLKNFMKASTLLGSMLNSFDISNYDFQEKLEFNKDYFQDRKLMIAKFFSQTVLKIILYDVRNVILKNILQ